jgi:ATP-dependent Clp protease ATP-binding subunit ClpC
MDAVKKMFRPEFLNRIDDIVVFQSLERQELLQITRLMLSDVVRRAADQSVELSVNDEACQLLLDRGFDPKYGARPIRRTIQKMVEDRLADMILEGSLTPGDRVSLARDRKKSADEELPEAVDVYELKFIKEADAAKV